MMRAAKMSKMVTFLPVLWLVISNTALASAYKSEDTNNQVEYSQIPPQSGQVTEIPPPPLPASSLQSEQTGAQQLIEEQQKKEARDKQEKALNAAKEEEEKAMAHNCQQFRTYLINLESKERIKLIDAEGNTVLLSQEQRAAEIAKANEGIKTYCKDPSQPENQSILPSTGDKKE